MTKEVPIVKPPYHLLVGSARPWEESRCCDDRPPVIARTHRPATPVRWARKLSVALPAAVAVFRRQVARPIDEPIGVGTTVISTTGRELGTVRDVVVELGSGRASYAVSPEESVGLGRVLLLPRDVVHDRDDVAVVEEHVLRRLERRIA
jgi:sporulation protein YlmC with PRC-barrel domain